MKIPIQTQKRAISRLSREQLEALAVGVSISLYGSAYVPGDGDLTEEEAAAFALAEGDLYLDAEKQWTQSAIENVAEDLESAGLSIEAAAKSAAEPDEDPPVRFVMPRPAVHSKFRPILWPDQVIGKRESRRIREAHNALYNSHHELLTAIDGLIDATEGIAGLDPVQCEAIKQARAARDGATQ